MENSAYVAETMLKSRMLSHWRLQMKAVNVAMLHELCKLGMPGNPQYLVNEPIEKQKEYGYPASTSYRFNSVLLI